MALSPLQRLRMAVADRPRVALREQVGIGDGICTQYQTQLYPVVVASETVLVNGVPVAGYVLDYATGLLALTNAPATNATILVTYTWTTFSDTELDDLLARYGARNSAIHALLWLLADTDRFIRYTFGQESVDRSATREGLENLVAQLRSMSPSGAVVLVKAESAADKVLLSPFRGDERDAWATT